MVGSHSFILSQLVFFSVGHAAAASSASTTKAAEHHFWKPFPGFGGGSTVTETETETLTITGDAITIVQTEVSTTTLQGNPVTVTANGPSNTATQTVTITNVPATITSTYYRPVYETSTETDFVTQVSTRTDIITRYLTLPGEITTATLVPNSKTLTVPQYVTVTVPTTLSYGVPTTETVTFPVETQTVYVPTNGGAQTVYVPTTLTVGCGCDPTTPAPPAPPTPPPCTPPPPPPCDTPTPLPNPSCKVCQAPVQQCNCAGGPSVERDPIPVRLHRKIINRARDYINSEDREFDTKNWKASSEVNVKYKSKIAKAPTSYVRYRKDNVPCGCNSTPERVRKDNAPCGCNAGQPAAAPAYNYRYERAHGHY